MIKRYFIIIVSLLAIVPFISAQEKSLKREVTLYNPYKPSLNQSAKIGYMPDMTDTAMFRPQFSYHVTATPFMPEYTVSPIKAATLQPDPLDKLYRSFVRLGMGSHISPLAEVSITNERSKKGALGFYGRHYSNNGKVPLGNGQRVFAGYMDNDVSLFGRKFFKSTVVGGSIDFLQRGRHAYGYNPEILDYFPGKKDTKVSYGNIGADVAVTSTSVDSSRFAYDFRLGFDHFYNNADISQNSFSFSGEMAKAYKGFFAGAGLDFRHYSVPATVQPFSDYIAGVNPFVKKSTIQWSFKVGMQAVLERNLEEEAKLHIYPDLGFGFSIVPSYVSFFSSLTGRLESNDPLKVSEENPFLSPRLSNSFLLLLPNTDHELVASAGLRGNSGIGGNYEISASYSLISDMLFYTNFEVPSDSVFGRGNYFIAQPDDVDLLTIHGAVSGKITGKLSFQTSANLYRYTTTLLEHPYNMPDWDASLGFKYNLRDKIIAGMEFTLLGERKQQVFKPLASSGNIIVDRPLHPNLNLTAEYRYSKILSFWTSFSSLSHQRYFEWAYYPSHRFLFMLGFTYSL